MLKKVTDFSITGWLLKHALQQPMVDAFVLIAWIVFAVAFVIRILDMILYEKSSINEKVEPDKISTCLQMTNNEVAGHLEKCSKNDLPFINKLHEQHNFDLNIRLIVANLAQYIFNSIENKTLTKKDLFISLYTFNPQKNTLVYELHYDEKRDVIKSKEIGLCDAKYQEYECVKCFKAKHQQNSYVLKKKEYKGGHAKRVKSMEHYIGCKLFGKNNIYGFLNIEIHKKNVFDTQEDMEKYMEEIIMPFKLLLEYQYLKKDFFSSFNEFDQNWQRAST